MKKTRSAKRALLMSALSLLLCVSMLVGTTFAWFTDSVTSAGNIIQSGTLDVDMVDAAGNSLAGQVIEFVTADGRDQDEILWEPGCRYYTEAFDIVNKGNLALKYEIHINGIDGNAKLLEAIEWTVTVNGSTTPLADLKGELLPGQEVKNIVLSGHMLEEAGNEYQGLTAEGISIVVYATQLTHEEDSFDDQYDKNAEFAATTMLNKVAAVAAGESATVKLESDGYVVINETNAIGAKVSGDVTLDLNGKTLFVKVEDGDAHMSLFNIVKGGKLTVTGNGTIEMLSGKNPSKVTAIFNNTAGTLVIQNGTYKMDVKTYAQGSMIPTIIDNNSSAGEALVTINGGNFYHTRNMFRNFSGVQSTLTINGGTFNGEADDWAAIWNQKPSASVAEGKGVVNVNGGTFNYVEISNEFNTGVTIADGVTVPEKVSDQAGLNGAIKNNAEIYLADGNYTLPTLSGKTGVTIIGGEDTVIGGENAETGFGWGNFGTNTVIKNVTFYGTSNGVRWSYAQGGTIVFENCAFLGNGRGGFHIDDAAGATLIFKNCTLSGFNAFAGSAEKVVLDGCTMTNNGKYNGLNMYCDLELNDCKFEFTGVGSEFVDFEAAGQTLTVTNCSATKNGVAIDLVDMIGGSKISQTTITIDGVSVVK